MEYAKLTSPYLNNHDDSEQDSYHGLLKTLELDWREEKITRLSKYLM
jgi:hypothetical protein